MRNLLVVLPLLLISACQSIKPEANDAQAIAAEIPFEVLHCDIDYDQPQLSFEQMLAEDPALYRDIWDRLREGMDLDLSYDNPRIKVQRDWYARNQSYLDRVFTRADRYLHYMLVEAEKRDIPTEMVLLPVVESAFDPFAYSHGRASGPWQFIPGTGKMFGLKQGYWYDGRRDIVESTRAAYEYLSSLQKRFDGDWLLALAAYNAGAGNVNKAIRRNKRLGKPTDFWHLKLPKETLAYVPKLLAISQIVADPDRYEVNIRPIDNYPRFAAVDIGSQIDLSKAAELAGVPLEQIYLFNPGFNQWATDPNGPHRLLIPIENAKRFERELAVLPENERVKWISYRVKSGDTLGKIASRYHTTTKRLKQVNRLRNHIIRKGQNLLIPSPKGNSQQYTLNEANRKNKILSRNKPGKQKKVIVVRKGDSLWSIANSYNIKTRALAKWNAMAPRDPIKPGDELIVWLDAQVAAQYAAQTTSHNNPAMIRNIQYRVRRGDSLSKIANKFNVSVKQICRWNNIDPKKYLRPGQRLKLVVDVRNTYR